MTKHAKSRRTELKGWRSTKDQLPAGINSTDLEKMAGRVKRILDNGHNLSKGDLAILKQVHLLCLRTVAVSRRGNLNKLTDQLSDHSNTLHKYGFKEDKHIVPLNLWVTRRVFHEEEGIEKLLRRVEAKIAEINKN
ncbi:MAG: hypothetical protein ABIG40_02640 [Parcubacteria group bacterium]